jgi:hypothetical protein
LRPLLSGFTNAKVSDYKSSRNTKSTKYPKKYDETGRETVNFTEQQYVKLKFVMYICARNPYIFNVNAYSAKYLIYTSQQRFVI